MANVEIEWVSGDFVLDGAAKTRTVLEGHVWYSFLGRGRMGSIDAQHLIDLYLSDARICSNRRARKCFSVQSVVLILLDELHQSSSIP